MNIFGSVPLLWRLVLSETPCLRSVPPASRWRQQWLLECGERAAPLVRVLAGESRTAYLPVDTRDRACREGPPALRELQWIDAASACLHGRASWPRSLAHRDGAMTNFVYRSWKEGLSDLARIALCQIPNTPAAAEWFRQAFKGNRTEILLGAETLGVAMTGAAAVASEAIQGPASPSAQRSMRWTTPSSAIPPPSSIEGADATCIRPTLTVRGGTRLWSRSAPSPLPRIPTAVQRTWPPLRSTARPKRIACIDPPHRAAMARSAYMDEPTARHQSLPSRCA